jgi:Alpha/beta hydrolase
MAGFDQVTIYADPAQMLTGAQGLAGVAAKLGPAAVRHRTVELAPGSFAAVTHSAAAQQAWKRAAGLLATYLATTTPAVESLSEGVYRSSKAYRSADARVAEMYRELLLLLDQGGTGGPGGAAALVGNDGIPPPGTHPDAVHDWWQSLGEDGRAKVIAEHPERIGPLDGVPVDARDQANRALLDREAAHQRQLIKEYERQPAVLAAELSEAKAKVVALEAIRTRLDGEPRAYLLGISGADDGRAIVAVGNPDTARQVLTYVPGMASDLSTVPTQVDRMDAIVARAPANTAAVLWLGYDAPDLGPQVLLESYARDASEPLSRFQDGLRATHLGEPSHNVLLAHSYGTTTYGITAATQGVSADSVYLIGSIGSEQQSAHGFLGTSSANVYVTTHGPDVAHILPSVDYYGPDPSSPPFDAQHLPGDYDGILDSHTSYLFRPEILDNITGLLTRR